jgi:hypothetical protein
MSPCWSASSEAASSQREDPLPAAARVAFDGRDGDAFGVWSEYLSECNGFGAVATGITGGTGVDVTELGGSDTSAAERGGGGERDGGGFVGFTGA